MSRVSLAFFFLATSALAAAQLSVDTKLGQPKGWMPDGWGSYVMKLSNTGLSSLKVVKWTAGWKVNGKAVGDPWGGELALSIEPGKSKERSEVGYMSPTYYKASLPGAPEIVGSYSVVQDGKTVEVPFHVSVPGAFLPEPLKIIKGKTVGLALMESRYKNFKRLDRTLKWIDEAYQRMIDLTGEHPFGGETMIFKESPAHPYWAYAGKEMILNTDYVADTLKDFDNGIVAFGWVHEVGHNFDVLGDWYIWNGAAAEFQANFKLVNAIETMPDRDFLIRLSANTPGYGINPGVCTPTQLVDRFFLLFGDAYLADPKRDWKSMTSDDTHTFFQRIQRAYGWEPFRATYRTYRTLADKGLKIPETPEEKINLHAAILSKECKYDLAPLFARWRFPVTEESMKAAAVKYGIQ
ncbi:hypothetical protein BH11ARM1_BH11ARM1_09710 [soil metagenome]